MPVSRPFRIRVLDRSHPSPFFELARSIFPRARIRLGGPDEVFLAYSASRPVGFLHLRPLGRSVYLQAIGVAPAHRAQGLGTRLLSFARRRAASQGGLSLKVKCANMAALRLYRAAGFWPERLSQNVWVLRWKPST